MQEDKKVIMDEVSENGVTKVTATIAIECEGEETRIVTISGSGMVGAMPDGEGVQVFLSGMGLPDSFAAIDHIVENLVEQALKRCNGNMGAMLHVAALSGMFAERCMEIRNNTLNKALTDGIGGLFTNASDETGQTH